MALSAHSTPDAARGYVKKTEQQRLAAALTPHSPKKTLLMTTLR